MNEIIRKLMDKTNENIQKVFDLTNQVIGSTASIFGDDIEIEVDPNTNIFKFNYDPFTCEIITDINIMKVKIFVKIESKVLASCIIGIDGFFEEAYTRIDVQFKRKLVDWFTIISGNIDISTLGLAIDNEVKIDDEIKTNEDDENISD